MVRIAFSCSRKQGTPAVQSWTWILILRLQEESLRQFLRKQTPSWALNNWLKSGPDGTVSGQMVGLAQTFQCCQTPGWERAAPLRSWALCLPLTCRKEPAHPPRSGISRGYNNACTAWGTERNGFSVSV